MTALCIADEIAMILTRDGELQQCISLQELDVGYFYSAFDQFVDVWCGGGHQYLYWQFGYSTTELLIDSVIVASYMIAVVCALQEIRRHVVLVRIR